MVEVLLWIYGISTVLSVYLHYRDSSTVGEFLYELFWCFVPAFNTIYCIYEMVLFLKDTDLYWWFSGKMETLTDIWDRWMKTKI